MASPSLISFSGEGTFEVGPGGWLYNTGRGSTIRAAGAKVVVTGTSSAGSGVVQATNGSAILGTGSNTIVIVEGGSVFGDETSNLYPVINMNNQENTGDNVFVYGGSVVAIADSLYVDSNGNVVGYGIQTYGNVVVSGGKVSSTTANGRAINLVGYESTATINGGEVCADGVGGVAISSATTNVASVSYASVYVTGGKVWATSGYAIRTTGANSIVEVTGGMVSATSGNAIRTEGASASVTVSGGFVFAYGSAIPGTNNVIRMYSGGTPIIDDPSVVVAWNHPSIGPHFVYIEGSHTNLIVSPVGSTVNWHNDNVHSGISYMNGMNTGFFPISNVTVTSYNIRYVLNGGSLPVDAPSSYSGVDLALDIPDAFGVYEFDGWSVACANGTVVVVPAGFSILEGTYGDLTLTALWDTGVFAEYNIVYVLNGGVDVFGNPSLYTVEGLPLDIVDPTRAGYVFLGWTVKYADGRTVGMVRAFSITEGVMGDIVLTANWGEDVYLEEYVVIYNGNGHTSGTVPIDSNSPYLSGSQVTVLGQNSLSRNGYTFLGWTTNPNSNAQAYLVDSTFTIVDNVVLYAIWKQTVWYSVNYQPGAHGTFGEQITDNLSYGDPTPKAPEVSGETGWKFTGWSPVLSVTVTNNAVYVAQWTQEIVVVRFVDWDERLLKSETVSYGGSASAPANPYRVGYNFTGWNRDFTNVVSDIIVVAQYSLIDSGDVSPSPSVTPSPSVAPPATVSPSPSVTPSHRDNETEAPLEGWALANLVLSATGAILAVLGAIWVLLRKGDAPQKQHRNMWLVAVFVLGVSGVAMFLLTSNLSHSMVLVNNWTALNAAIFIVQIICLTLASKHKKTV